MKYALSIILFVGLFASPLYAYLIYLDRHLEVVGLTVAPDTDFLGRDVMAFSGEIRNTHDVYGIQLIEVYVVLKKEGKIIERSWVYDDDDGMVPDSEGYDTLLPGATTSFRVCREPRHLFGCGPCICSMSTTSTMCVLKG